MTRPPRNPISKRSAIGLESYFDGLGLGEWCIIADSEGLGEWCIMADGLGLGEWCIIADSLGEGDVEVLVFAAVPHAVPVKARATINPATGLLTRM